MKEEHYTIVATICLISLSVMTVLHLGWTDRRKILISGLKLLFYFYFPCYIKNRKSITHLFKSLLLPFAGLIRIISVVWDAGDFILSRMYGLIWLYSAIGTSIWKWRTDRHLTYYNTIFFLYQVGMLVYSASILYNGFGLTGQNVTISGVTRAGACIYLLKILNAPVYLKRNLDKPLICLSFFTPIIAVGLFLLL